MRNSFWQIFRYGIVGASNTLITVAVIAALLWAGLGPIASNFIGFAAGLVNSFVLNSRFTFRHSLDLRKSGSFLASFGISYVANLLVVIFVKSFFAPSSFIPQLAGILTYNLVFFVLMKMWTFRKHG